MNQDPTPGSRKRAVDVSENSVFSREGDDDSTLRIKKTVLIIAGLLLIIAALIGNLSLMWSNRETETPAPDQEQQEESVLSNKMIGALVIVFVTGLGAGTFLGYGIKTALDGRNTAEHTKKEEHDEEPPASPVAPVRTEVQNSKEVQFEETEKAESNYATDAQNQSSSELLSEDHGAVQSKKKAPSRASDAIRPCRDDEEETNNTGKLIIFSLSLILFFVLLLFVTLLINDVL